MKTWKKVLIGVGAVVVLAMIVSVTVYQSSKNLVTVQTGKVQKQNLAAVVSASGEIKPKTYANIGANALGRIIKLHVKEGERVQKGQLLAQLGERAVAGRCERHSRVGAGGGDRCGRRRGCAKDLARRLGPR